MGETAEELRREIEQTRSGLGDTLDAIGDRVSPGRVLERKKNRMTGGVRSAVDRVMGKAHDAQQSVSGAGHGTVDTVRDLPDTIKSQAQGTPLIAGVVAFAAGFMIAAAFPPSDTEKAGASQLLDKVEPIKAELSHVGQEIAEHLKEPAMQAVEEVKSAAQDGAQSVTDTAQQAAADTKEQAHDAVDTVKDQATSGPNQT
jgi:ElaB/YqjD/DUF883 family membrane-anchored ribosome-binding protein